jgi:predicted CoA-binding protein
MKKLIWLISAFFMAACMQTLPAVKVAEESMVQDCERIATLSEITDTGRVLDNYRPPEHQDEILQRAANLGATHIVWIYDYRIGSAAVAYRCER